MISLSAYFISRVFSRKHIALIGENSYNWLVTYFAVVNSNNVIVPIDKELSPDEVHDIFLRDFVNQHKLLCVVNASCEDINAEEVKGRVDIEYKGKVHTVEVMGNGRLDWVSNAIKQVTGIDYLLESYVEHALEEKSTSKAASYVSIVENGNIHWGVGIHRDIMTSSIRALVSAVNRMLAKEEE